jgi:hypothetical protein
MEHNDTDLFVIEIQFSTQDLRYLTDWDSTKCREWLQNNWGEITEAVDVSFDSVLESMIGFNNDDN